MALRGALKGIGSIKDKAAEKAKGFDGESPFIKLEDGDSVKLRFLQEFDADSPLYDDRRGTVAVVEEHSNPKDYKLRAVCTFEEEGRCWACEQTSLPEIGKKWRPRMRFYANVLVRDENGDRVKILAQGFGAKNVGNLLIEMAEEYGGLGGADFKLSRKGSGLSDTSYSLIPLAAKPLSKADEKHEVIDLSKFIKYVAYDSQADFYAGNLKEEEGGKASDWVS